MPMREAAWRHTTLNVKAIAVPSSQPAGDDEVMTLAVLGDAGGVVLKVVPGKMIPGGAR